MVGFARVRDTVESAAGKVTASAETIAKSIGVAIGIAAVALIVSVIALFMAGRVRPA